jgi:hypothetical protein
MDPFLTITMVIQPNNNNNDQQHHEYPKKQDMVDELVSIIMKQRRWCDDCLNYRDRDNDSALASSNNCIQNDSCREYKSTVRFANDLIHSRRADTFWYIDGEFPMTLFAEKFPLLDFQVSSCPQERMGTQYKTGKKVRQSVATLEWIWKEIECN